MKHLTSISKFWDPLYRSEPLEIAESLPMLMQAIRSVFTSSRFYNTDVRISGILSKVVNQLIVASRKHLTNKSKTSIWDVEMKLLMEKIQQCKKMNDAFRSNYQLILQQMQEAGEPQFVCSDKYLFERLELFGERLSKICEFMEVYMRYKVLNRVAISGMEKFSQRIKNSFDVIAKKSYDPLAFRLADFDDDYIIFQTEISSVELEMEHFVECSVRKIESIDMRLVTLKRFERLNLDCLNLDGRYLDVAAMLNKEIEEIKDKYSEERAKPWIEWNSPPAVGRIMWARSLLKKMEEPMNVLKVHPGVLEHEEAQPGVKRFNLLTEVLFHYEAIHHKAWFMYADAVRSKLEVPLIRKDPETNQLMMNLDRHVLQVVKEAESMMKLGLEVPETAKVLAFCKLRVTDTFDTMKHLIARNDALRRSIYPMFVPLMRVQLIRLERVFAPALSTVTWLNLNLVEYFAEVADVLLSIEQFVKEVSDINDMQTTRIKFIAHQVLIHLPDDPVTTTELKETNDQHRQLVEKQIEAKSFAAEAAAVELVNKFVAKSGIPDYEEESGKFQLPPEKITEINWRAEEIKPIDKYDWLSFEKLYKVVSFASPEENEILCFKDYDGLKYNVTLLHIDCVELFAYYNQRMISALAKSTIASMALLKERSNIAGHVHVLPCGEMSQKPLIKASIELRIPNFVLVPKLQDIQLQYEATVKNIIETHYGVNTWGKQARTEERKKRRPMVGEVRHDRTCFTKISEHKDVMRSKLGFNNGVLYFESKIESMLSELREKYEFLWKREREEEIEKFVQGNPLTGEIRDLLKHYDGITNEILKLDKVLCVKTIELDRGQMIDSLEAESTAWKTILGAKLSVVYRAILDELVEFILTQQRRLTRKLVDLDDCRRALDCLQVINENFIRMDRNLNLLEEIFAMFAAFHIFIRPEDSDRVDGLRYMFNTLMETAELVHVAVLKLQEPLMKELEAGVEQFQVDLATFDAEFAEAGPMVDGIPPREANHRVLLFETRVFELERRLEVLSSGEQLYGMPVGDFPVLKSRLKDLENLNQLYKLFMNVLRTMDEYSAINFKNVDMGKFSAEIDEFADR